MRRDYPWTVRYLRLFALQSILLLTLLFFGFDNDAGIPANARDRDQTRSNRTFTPDDRPNIVFILADDLDKTGAEAMKLRGMFQKEFGRAYVSDPLCCPSRASIFTGDYVHNHGVLHHRPPGGGYPLFRKHEDSTFAVSLDDAGYDTAFFGKYLNNYTSGKVPPGWDRWYAWEKNWYSPSQRESWDISDGGDNRRIPARSKHDTDLLTSEAVDFIERNGRDDAPLFLMLSVNQPHAPLDYPKRHRDSYQGEKVRQPSTNGLREKDFRDKPGWLRKEAVPITAERRREMDRQYRDRLRAAASMEDSVRRVRSALGKEADNTYFFFATDNGFHLGHHGLSTGKRTPYLTDIETPLWVSGPGVSRGKDDRLVSLIDLAPTFADLGGAELPGGQTDGRSLVPLLDIPGSRDVPWRQRLLVEGYRSGTTNKEIPIPDYKVTVGEDFTFHKYEDGFREFYDLRKDPGQLENSFRSLGDRRKDDLFAVTEKLLSCEGKTCRSAEGYSR